MNWWPHRSLEAAMLDSHWSDLAVIAKLRRRGPRA